jgi:hypothetical protein
MKEVFIKHYPVQEKSGRVSMQPFTITTTYDEYCITGKADCGDDMYGFKNMVVQGVPPPVDRARQFAYEQAIADTRTKTAQLRASKHG